jgi:pantothenate synthetase
MDVDYCKKIIENLKRRAELIPVMVVDKTDELNGYTRIAKEKDEERLKAQKLYNDAQKQRNKAFRDKQRLSRDIRVLNKELKEEIPRKTSYYERKIKQLQKPKDEKPQTKDKLDEVIENLQKKEFKKHA